MVNVENYFGMVRNILVKDFKNGYGYQHFGMTEEDMFQVGCLGLVKAGQRYDDSFDNKFTSFAEHYIRGEIKREIRDRGMLIHFSRSVKELSSKIRKLETIPTVEEAMAIFEVSEYNAKQALDLIHMQMLSGDFKLDSKDDLDGVTLFDAIDSGVNTEEEVESILRDEELIKRLSILNERDQEVLLLRLDGKSQREIGKIVGVSQVQVSRIIEKSIERINKQFGSYEE